MPKSSVEAKPKKIKIKHYLNKKLGLWMYNTPGREYFKRKRKTVIVISSLSESEEEEEEDEEEEEGEEEEEEEEAEEEPEEEEPEEDANDHMESEDAIWGETLNPRPRETTLRVGLDLSPL